MPSFEVHPPDPTPPRAVAAPGRAGPYSLHPLPALGGMFIYVTLHGEPIGLFFGATELAATAAVVDSVLQPIASTNGGNA